MFSILLQSFIKVILQILPQVGLGLESLQLTKRNKSISGRSFMIALGIFFEKDLIVQQQKAPQLPLDCSSRSPQSMGFKEGRWTSLFSLVSGPYQESVEGKGGLGSWLIGND